MQTNSLCARQPSAKRPAAQQVQYARRVSPIQQAKQVRQRPTHRLAGLIHRAASPVAVLLIFLCMALMSHFLFLPQFAGLPFVGFTYDGGDASAQLIPAVSLLERSLMDGTFFWSWDYGLGGDLFSEFSYYYSTSPLFYLQFSIKWLFGAAGGDFATTQAWRVVFSIIKQILCMLFMYLLIKREGKGRLAALTAGILYGCSFWYIDNSVAFDFMTDAMLWPPLLVMAFNRWNRTGSWMPLCLVLALSIASNFYFGYIVCVFCILFALVFAYRRENGQKWAAFIRGYLRRLGVLALVAIGAILLSSIAFIPSVIALLSADRAQVPLQVGIFPSLHFVKALPEILFFKGGMFSANDAQTYAFPLIAMLAPFLFKHLSPAGRKRTIFAALLVLLWLLPVVSSLMNGLSYPSNRWCYLVVFAVAYAVPDWIEYLATKGIRVVRPAVFVGLAVLALVVLATHNVRVQDLSGAPGYVFQLLGISDLVFFGLQVAFIAVILLKGTRQQTKQLTQQYMKQLAIPHPKQPCAGRVSSCAYMRQLAIPHSKQPPQQRRDEADRVYGVPLSAAALALLAGAVLLAMPFGPYAAYAGFRDMGGAVTFSSLEQLNKTFEGDTSNQETYRLLAQAGVESEAGKGVGPGTASEARTGVRSVAESEAGVKTKTEPGVAAHVQIDTDANAGVDANSGTDSIDANNTFFRTADEETYQDDANYRRFENRSWILGTHPVSVYNSLITKDISQWIKRERQVTPTTRSASQYRGFGHRLFIENAWGIEYKFNTTEASNLYGYEPLDDSSHESLGDTSQVLGAQDASNENASQTNISHTNTSQTNAPSSDEATEGKTTEGKTTADKVTMDRVTAPTKEIWHNRYATGIDLWYSTATAKSSTSTWSFEEGDAALLQTAVVDDDVANCLALPSGTLESTVTALPLDTSNAHFDNCSLSNGILQVDSGGGSITIDLPDGLGSGECLLSFTLKNTQEESFTFRVNGEEYWQGGKTHRWRYPIDNYSLCFPEPEGSLKVNISAGTYTVDNVQLEFGSYSRLADWANSVNRYGLADLTVEKNSITGTIHTDEAGILALAIPYKKGWTCLVDGKPADSFVVNGIFAGVFLDAGDHTIQWSYANPYLPFAAGLSILTGMALAAIWYFRRRKSGSDVLTRKQITHPSIQPRSQSRVRLHSPHLLENDLAKQHEVPRHNADHSSELSNKRHNADTSHI